MQRSRGLGAVLAVLVVASLAQWGQPGHLYISHARLLRYSFASAQAARLPFIPPIYYASWFSKLAADPLGYLIVLQKFHFYVSWLELDLSCTTENADKLHSSQ